MQKEMQFSLKARVYRLLAKHYFITEREKKDYAKKLAKILLELHRVHLELAHLNPNAPKVISIQNQGGIHELEIVKLIRHVQNRLKVLPGEPVEAKSIQSAVCLSVC